MSDTDHPSIDLKSLHPWVEFRDVTTVICLRWGGKTYEVPMTNVSPVGFTEKTEGRE